MDPLLIIIAKLFFVVCLVSPAQFQADAKSTWDFIDNDSEHSSKIDPELLKRLHAPHGKADVVVEFADLSDVDMVNAISYELASKNITSKKDQRDAMCSVLFNLIDKSQKDVLAFLQTERKASNRERDFTYESIFTIISIRHGDLRLVKDLARFAEVESITPDNIEEVK